MDIPGDSSTSAVVQVGVPFLGDIETLGDRDWLRLDVEVGKSYSFSITEPIGSSLTGEINLLDTGGVLLVSRVSEKQSLATAILFQP
ncbi:MAG: hypothetical protein AAF439_04955 [Pseudomonadota bacterium]